MKKKTIHYFIDLDGDVMCIINVRENGFRRLACFGSLKEVYKYYPETEYKYIDLLGE